MTLLNSIIANIVKCNIYVYYAIVLLGLKRLSETFNFINLSIIIMLIIN